MATFIDLDLATGSNNGSDWANAYQTWTAAQTGTSNFTTGGPFIVRYNSSEATGASKTITGPTSTASHAVLISADGTGSSWTKTNATTKQIDATGGSYNLIFDGSFSHIGMYYSAGALIKFDADNDELQRVHDCTLAPGQGSNIVGKATLVGCTLSGENSASTDTTALIGTNVAGDHIALQNCSLSNMTNRTGPLASGSFQACFSFSACDFSAGTNLSSIITMIPAGTYEATHCEYASGVPHSLTNNKTILGQNISVNCGNASDAPESMTFMNTHGWITSDTTVYRTGGASIEGTPVSWKFVTTSASDYIGGHGPWIYGVLSSTGSKTFTVYIAHNAQGSGAGSDFLNSEVWLEVECLQDSGKGLWTASDDHVWAYTGADAVQTDDTGSSWSGSPGSNLQSLAVTATVAGTGQYRARVCYGAAATFYVDPLVTVS